MPYLLVRHGVRDYAHWRALFDADAADQRAAGMHVLHVFRDPGNPNIAVFLFEVEDRARAEAFMARPGGEKIAEAAGVQPPFDVHWLEK
jgi:quinol monooxygenase YgiN